MFPGIGTIIGLIGSLLGRGLNIFEEGQKFKHELALREIDHRHEISLLQEQSKLRTIEIENEQAIANINAASSALSGSYSHDESYGVPSQWAVNTLRLVRPALTLFLIAGYFILLFRIDAFSNFSTVEKLVGQVFTLCEVSLAWWFGSHKLGSGTGSSK